MAEKLNRRWIGCDLGRWGIHTTRKRLLGIKECRPFAVLNLGKDERQYWQALTFGVHGEYIAFMLKLYGAVPVAGRAHIHGKKSEALVHVAAVDVPLTTEAIEAAVDECAKLKKRELHVLSWDWEIGRCDVVAGIARQKEIKLLLLQIPREVMDPRAVQKGDASFFPLGYLEAEVEQPGNFTARVAARSRILRF